MAQIVFVNVLHKILRELLLLVILQQFSASIIVKVILPICNRKSEIEENLNVATD